MVEKKEGAEMTCTKCQTKLVCHMSNYKNNENKLQWQNEDGTAHYHTKDGKNFTCNIPNEIELKPHDENQSTLNPEKIPDGISLNAKVDRIFAMLEDIKENGVKIRE